MIAISIKSKIILFFIALVSLIFLFIGDLWLMLDNARALTELEVRRYESRQLAEDLRRSSDDLTRMARSYIATGDQKYLRYFERISAIRDGTSPYPVNYQNIYWDFVSSDEDYQTATKPGVSIIDQMKVLHFSKKELALLSQAKIQSDELIKLERQAFRKIQGLTLKDNGTSIIQGSPDREKALQIIFGKDYYRAKAGIMEKIDAFFKLLDTRTLAEVKGGEARQKDLMDVAILLSLVMVALASVGFFIFRKDMIKPLNNITDWVKRMKNADYKFDTTAFNDDEFGVLANAFSEMAQQVSGHIAELEEISSTDPLTKLNNQIALDKALYNQKYAFERYSNPCAILMLDMDHFKNVNDRFGHLAGDRVLIEISNIVNETTRITDVTGRWGGEEFLVICPNTDLDQGAVLAELIRQRAENHKFQINDQITVSIGVSAFSIGTSIERTVKEADLALYQAKEKGRNRICSFFPDTMV